MKFLRLLPFAVLVILIAVVAVPLWQGGAPKPPDVMTGRAVPSAPLPGLDPALLRQGQVVVNFFASWCGPCAQEQPILSHLAAETGVPVVGIAYKDSVSAITAWLETHGNPFRVVAYDTGGVAAIDWGVYGVPETFLIENGVIRWRHVGPLDDVVYRRDLLPQLTRQGGAG